MSFSAVKVWKGSQCINFFLCINLSRCSECLLLEPCVHCIFLKEESDRVRGIIFYAVYILRKLLLLYFLKFK